MTQARGTLPSGRSCRRFAGHAPAGPWGAGHLQPAWLAEVAFGSWLWGAQVPPRPLSQAQDRCGRRKCWSPEGHQAPQSCLLCRSGVGAGVGRDTEPASLGSIAANPILGPLVPQLSTPR